MFNKSAGCEDKDFRKCLRDGMSIEVLSDNTGVRELWQERDEDSNEIC